MRPEEGRFGVWEDLLGFKDQGQQLTAAHKEESGNRPAYVYGNYVRKNGARNGGEPWTVFYGQIHDEDK